MSTIFKKQVERYISYFEDKLHKYMQPMHIKPAILQESIEYSLFAGGKRIRPILMYAVTEIVGGDMQNVSNFAIAMEMIHTYSLIHDDLPAMDNANMRRNLPTNHIRFGEGQAVLAGDALLSEAFSICMQESLLGEEYRQAGICLAQCAGIYGMVAGQAADIFYQNRTDSVNEENLQFIHLHKTGKLIIASLLIPAYLQKVDATILHHFYAFGDYLGKIYQFTDDLLDIQGSNKLLGKDIGLDAKTNKLVATSVYGKEGCQKLLQEYQQKAMSILDSMPLQTDFLKDFLQYLLDRKK